MAPLFVLSPPTRGEMDLIVIGPLRDPSVETDNPDARVASVRNLTGILQEPYTGGNRTNLSYQNGVLSVAGDRPFVVDYLRCSG
jgi:hypothetical protein